MLHAALQSSLGARPECLEKSPRPKCEPTSLLLPHCPQQESESRFRRYGEDPGEPDEENEIPVLVR